jgi:F0F1-type ATP synthase membrane subunit c/vacuolar-type H+-ATPase subunit K
MSTWKSFKQEPDRVSARRLAAIGVAGLLVFGVGALGAASVQRSAHGTVRGSVSRPPEVAGKVEVGMVLQPPFGDSIAAAKNEEARRRLETSGWVDRDAGTVHVPIEQAMEIIARRGKL